MLEIPDPFPTELVAGDPEHRGDLDRRHGDFLVELDVKLGRVDELLEPLFVGRPGCRVPGQLFKEPSHIIRWAPADPRNVPGEFEQILPDREPPLQAALLCGVLQDEGPGKLEELLDVLS